jgi:hypothetical protein
MGVLLTSPARCGNSEESKSSVRRSIADRAAFVIVQRVIFVCQTLSSPTKDWAILNHLKMPERVPSK